jgi:hypothetical protein
MPKNGIAVRLAPEPISAKPGAAPAATAIQIGVAMADAVEALGAGLADYDAGGLTDTNRARGGVTIAKIVEMQLAALGDMPDFSAVALAEGKRILLARHGATLRQHLGTDAGIDDTFDMLLSHILAVATKVSAIEAVYRAN